MNLLITVFYTIHHHRSTRLMRDGHWNWCLNRVILLSHVLTHFRPEYVRRNIVAIALPVLRDWKIINSDFNLENPARCHGQKAVGNLKNLPVVVNRSPSCHGTTSIITSNSTTHSNKTITRHVHFPFQIGRFLFRHHLL
jgi:hypothetical protein